MADGRANVPVGITLPLPLPVPPSLALTPPPGTEVALRWPRAKALLLLVLRGADGFCNGPWGRPLPRVWLDLRTHF